MPSRIGQDDRLVRLTFPAQEKEKERKWIFLPRGYLGDFLGIFGDLAPNQMHTFVDAVMVPGKTFTYTDLERIRGRLCPPGNLTEGHSRFLGQDPKPSRHHILASSRGGERRGNTVGLPRGFHSQWHQVFGNLTVHETHAFLDTILRPGMRWTYTRLRQEQIQLMQQTAERRRSRKRGNHR